MISLICTSPISNLSTTNNVDTDIKNNEYSQYSATPMKNITVPLNDVIQIIKLQRIILNNIHFYYNKVL